ncbi:16S rRNA m(2)G 1207 methyltransferase [Marinobacter daqiaonensis]|uniref:Ribosomal RNA small subunit methyltransferase C n=1 Tax=Marinobacter daqiaonensis TaxID=650891 RepID=A0A1I6H5C2_9GAMM|nr:class I SAM-dependent methyltransferase [Marinobacter daqiaonensis]SFR49604.1 16S rRNA m(2)G 1207 methyltransferase [Marinobacter daqiaonensis]
MSEYVSDGLNAVSALSRNLDLLTGRVAFIGLPSSGLLAQLQAGDERPLVISEHAGVASRLQSSGLCHVQFGYRMPEPALLPMDTVALFVPKSRQALTMQLALASAMLARGGRIVLVGEKREGVAGASRQLGALDPDARKVDSARHCQVWLAAPATVGGGFDITSWLTWHEVTAAGTTVSVAGLPGIFSEGRLDEGTGRLLDTLAEVPPQGPVLDLACGAGVIGTWLQARYPGLGPVDAVDVQAQAVACTRHTYEANNAGGQVIASDGLPESLGRYRTLVTNPPFHSGVRTDTSMTEGFLRQARAHLQPGGELRLVANRFLPYQPLLERCVGASQVLFEDRKFAVYQARVRS